MSIPLAPGPAQDPPPAGLGRPRPRAWETVVLSSLLAVPPVLLATFWLTWRVRDERARALSPDDYTLFDPHGYVLIFGSVVLLGLALVTGLALIPWTVRLLRRRARLAWFPVVVNVVDLLPLPGLVLLVLFLAAAPLRL